MIPVPSRCARLLPLAAVALALLAVAVPVRADAPEPERAAIEAVLARAGLLADPFGADGGPTSLDERSVTSRVQCDAPRLTVEYGSPDGGGRARSAVVTIARWVTGTLEIRTTGPRGREQVVSKLVRDSCVRQVTLRRMPTPDDPAAALWRVATMSALVRLTPSGRASLPLVDLNTSAVSSGHISVQSDLDELAVLPQTCAVTAPGGAVRVWIGGLDADAAVYVFAGGQRVAAVHRDGAHAEAVVSLTGPAGLREIGVTVYPHRTLADAAAPADTRTWVLPILVGSPPPPTQEYFAL